MKSHFQLGSGAEALFACVSIWFCAALHGAGEGDRGDLGWRHGRLAFGLYERYPSVSLPCTLSLLFACCGGKGLGGRLSKVDLGWVFTAFTTSAWGKRRSRVMGQGVMFSVYHAAGMARTGGSGPAFVNASSTLVDLRPRI